MLYLDKINDSAKQSYTLIGGNNEQIPFYLWYAPTQQCWFYNLEYGDFKVNGIQLCVSPNCLRAFKNEIPFGLACTSIDGLDPMYISDFKTGRISLFLMTEAEVNEIEGSFFGI